MLAFSWYTYLTLRPPSSQAISPPLDTSGAHLWQEALAKDKCSHVRIQERVQESVAIRAANVGLKFPFCQISHRLAGFKSLRVFYEFKSSASWIMIDNFPLDILSSGHFCSLICRKGCIEQKQKNRKNIKVVLCKKRLEKHQMLRQSKNFEKWQSGQKWLYLWTKL